MSSLKPEIARREQDLAAALRARHADTLQGALGHLDDVRAVAVVISLSLPSARTRTGQLLALHLANLLGRLEGVVASVSVSIDEDSPVELLPGVDHRDAAGGGLLSAAVLRSARLARPDQASPPEALRHCSRGALVVRIGALRAGEAVVHTAASAWVAYVGAKPGPECVDDERSATGAHAAAALAAAEIFRHLRVVGDLSSGPSALLFSTWDWTFSTSLTDGSPTKSSLQALYDVGLLRFTLVGAGAVGCAFLLAMWASQVPVFEGLVIDGDQVSATNLNRYVLFGLSDLGCAKAVRAAELLERQRPRFSLRPVPEWWSDYRRRDSYPIRLLISAVDTNRARHQLQDALPCLVFGGSTLALRAQVDRYDLASAESNCLKCHNPPEPVETDASLRARLLQLDRTVLRLEAIDRGVEPDLLKRYVDDLRTGGDGCAILAGSSLDKLRRASGESNFAVSFVSSLAGTLLAAQVMRESSGAGVLLRPGHSRGLFQLWRPGAVSNSVRKGDPNAVCWCRQAEVRNVYNALWGTAGA